MRELGIRVSFIVNVTPPAWSGTEMSHTMYVTAIFDMVHPLTFGSCVPTFHGPHAGRPGLDGTSCKNEYYVRLLSYFSTRLNVSCYFLRSCILINACVS